jgi:hypothetical protein
VTHPLLARLASRDPDARAAACAEMAADPAGVLFADALAEALGDPVKAVAQAASDALVSLARGHDVGEALRRALHSGEPPRRLWAALSLARLSPPELRWLPALVAGLDFDDGKLRWKAARLLVETGRLYSEVLPVLLGVAAGDRPTARRMAYFCLRELGPDDPRVAAALLAGTRDPDLEARRAAHAGLAALLEPPDPVLEALSGILDDAAADGACRRIATVALAELGARRAGGLPEPALGALRRAGQQSADPDLRRGAERALQRLSGQKSSASSE